MLINAAFSHSNEECSPYFLVITHQIQSRDDIDGLMQERRNSIANALENVFLAPSPPYKECHQVEAVLTFINVDRFSNGRPPLTDLATPVDRNINAEDS